MLDGGMCGGACCASAAPQPGQQRSVSAYQLCRLLKGSAPLVTVKLTRVDDGDILGITLCHAILDGMRWPGLAAHLAARYRQVAGGPAAEASELLHPIDRSVLSLEWYAR